MPDAEHPPFEGPVAFHEHVALTRASRDDRPSRNVSLVFELEGPVDAVALGQAVRWLGARHEGLRSGFHPTAEGFRRRVYEPRLELEVVDLESRPEADVRAAIRARLRTVFPLDQAPLASMTLIRTGPERARFVAVVDHVVVDFLGARTALRQLGSAYDRFLAGETPTLGPAPQPRDLVEELAAERASADADRERWAVPWPADGFRLDPDPGRPGGRDPETRLIAAPLPSHAGVSGAALVVTAFARSLQRVCGRDDVGFSLARSGRSSGRQRHVVASLVYTDTFVARSAPAQVAESEAFVRDLSPWRRMYNAVVGPPTRRILLNLLGPRCRLPLAGAVSVERPDLLEPPQLWDAHDLVLQLVEVQDTPLAFLAYRACWLDPATADRILSGFVEELTALIRETP